MAWELKKVEDQRKELVESYFKGTFSVVELCNRFGVSRKTAYKWINRYKLYSTEGLKDLSRAPRCPHRSFSKDHIDLALDLKLKHRCWGPKKILTKLHRDYPIPK